MKNLIKLYTDSTISINRLAELLHENGISSMIKDNNAAGAITGFGTIQNTVELFVEKYDSEKAEQVISSLKL